MDMDEMNEEEYDDLGLGDDSFEDPGWKAGPDDVEDDDTSHGEQELEEEVEVGEKKTGAAQEAKKKKKAAVKVKRKLPKAKEVQPRYEDDVEGGLEYEDAASKEMREVFSRTGFFFGGRRVFPGPRRKEEGVSVRVAVPFCPFSGPEENDFEAFRAARMASDWKKDMQSLKRCGLFGSGEP